ncbi:hypothetical protein [Streptomyces sp. NPDC088554]|uniref:hypothetical protein n=1 Tax=Streptomyces sp. NPDC088554 TaxID=3365865 RepID=UPI0037FD95F8
MTTLANAIRLQFERDHPNGKNTLLCVGLCRQRKDRTDFRETPWHGRAASCIRCETFPGPAGRSLWHLTYDARLHWELEQSRAKLHMYRRFASWLKLQRLMASVPRSADVLRAHEQPYMDAIERAQRRWSSVISEALSKAHTLSEEEKWQTPTT